MGRAARSPRISRLWRVIAAVGLAAGGLVVVAQPAAASQFTVTTTADSGVGSLRQAVLDANASAGADVIVFDPGIDTQTITLTSGELSVTGELTVIGNGATNTIIDGNGTARIFDVGAAGLTIGGATLQNGVGTGDGGAVRSQGPVIVDASTITDNSASGNGGGVAAADLTIENGSVVRANHAGVNGGGAIAYTGDLTVTDSTIGGSSVADGNTANSDGGVAIPSGTGTVTITSSTVSHNTAPSNAAVVGAAAVVISGSTISSNDSAGILSGGVLTITDSTVSSNAGGSGGGGGGVVGFGDVSITGSWVDQNTSPSVGGGLLIVGSDTASISDSTFSDNEQTDPGGFTGGGMVLVDTSATLTNVTISGNTAAAANGGGGLVIARQTPGTPSPDTVTIESSTIDGNAATAGAGIFVSPDAAATTVVSTILSNSTGPACDTTIPITDGGFNLLFNTAAGSCVFDAANDVTGADPSLDALTVNAPAALVPTMALSAGSPAADVVTTGCPPPATDARGVTRSQGDACDVGAFELEVTPPPPTTSTPTTTTPAVGPATGEAAGSGESATLPVTGGPGPGLSLLGVTLVAVGALLELAPRARGRALRHARR
jgi:hypothetical protein